jgi:hypothetical protein
MKSSQNIQRLGHTKFTSCSLYFVLKTLERAGDLKMLISFPFSVIFDENIFLIFFMYFQKFRLNHLLEPFNILAEKKYIIVPSGGHCAKRFFFLHVKEIYVIVIHLFDSRILLIIDLNKKKGKKGGGFIFIIAPSPSQGIYNCIINNKLINNKFRFSI